MPPGPPSACSVCVCADRPQNTINVPCQWQTSLGTQQSSGVLLRWKGCGPWRRHSARPPTRTVLLVDTQPRTAHTYTLQFQLDEKRDDFLCPLRAANVPAQQFLFADKRTLPCIATLQPSPCSFWWLSIVGTRTIRQNRKKDERNLDAYIYGVNKQTNISTAIS